MCVHFFLYRDSNHLQMLWLLPLPVDSQSYQKRNSSWDKKLVMSSSLLSSLPTVMNWATSNLNLKIQNNFQINFWTLFVVVVANGLLVLAILSRKKKQSNFKSLGKEDLVLFRKKSHTPFHWEMRSKCWKCMAFKIFFP